MASPRELVVVEVVKVEVESKELTEIGFGESYRTSVSRKFSRTGSEVVHEDEDEEREEGERRIVVNEDEEEEGMIL